MELRKSIAIDLSGFILLPRYSIPPQHPTDVGEVGTFSGERNPIPDRIIASSNHRIIYLYSMQRTSLLSGSIFAALSVALGAFGAHSLEPYVKNGMLTPYNLEVFATASRYQMYHALALIAVGIIAKLYGESKLLKAAMWMFIAGIIIFSGSLYLLSTRGITGIGTGILGPITPLGGLLFISGWILLIVQVIRTK